MNCPAMPPGGGRGMKFRKPFSPITRKITPARYRAITEAVLITGFSFSIGYFCRATLRASDRCLDVREHAELREHHRSRGVAVERLDLAVHETEDVTARRVHPLAGWWKDPYRRRKGPLV